MIVTAEKYFNSKTALDFIQIGIVQEKDALKQECKPKTKKKVRKSTGNKIQKTIKINKSEITSRVRPKKHKILF